jgi:hypothetical protein
MYYFFTKNVLGYIWAFFSQTPLVTLLLSSPDVRHESQLLYQLILSFQKKAD